MRVVRNMAFHPPPRLGHPPLHRTGIHGPHSEVSWMDAAIVGRATKFALASPWPHAYMYEIDAEQHW